MFNKDSREKFSKILREKRGEAETNERWRDLDQMLAQVNRESVYGDRVFTDNEILDEVAA